MTSNERRRRLTHRALPVLGVSAVVALGLGIVVGSGHDSTGEQAAERFARAWQRGDYRAMHSLLSEDTRKRYPLAAFTRAYEDASGTATAVGFVAGKRGRERDGKVRVPIAAETRVFGTVRSAIDIPLSGNSVAWTPNLTFPGVPAGIRLRREVRAPKRATIVSVDGKVLAQGDAGARTSPVGAGASIAGAVGPSEDATERTELYGLGFDRDAPVGKTGLERALDRDVRGVPGGRLLAGNRVLATATPRPAPTLKSSIDTRLQQSAVAALAGRFGGVAAIDPSSGAVRALAGIAFSAPQPPGSTFKIITSSAALEANLVKPTDKFPVETKAVLDGVDLENANGESCGGTFAESFAHSCNSVFAPLGVKVGAKRLVAMAERFGWNSQPEIPGAQPSSLPAAKDTRTPLEIGSAAIGQFRVLATPLQMASVAQAVGNDGVRVAPTLIAGARTARKRVVSRRVAATLEQLMLGVVRYGTGTAAQVPGIKVAGKTGTAELGDTRGEDEKPDGDPTNTDAWFTAFAPADKPKLAVAVLLVRNGAGGATAAPVARAVLGTQFGK